MKKINIICVGKIKEKFLRDGIEEYLKRLSKYAKCQVIELNDYSTAVSSVAIKKESEEIINALKGYTILLDIKGKMVTSPDLADIIDKAYITNSEISFIIGGSCGVNDDVRAKVNAKISFGSVTYPHQLMRLMVCEQVYRAFTIINGTPYHK